MLTVNSRTTVLRTKRMKAGVTAAMILVALIVSHGMGIGVAQAVSVSVGTGAGFVGDTVSVPITVDDVTGLGVVSYEVTITWSATRASFATTDGTGTLTDSWAAPTVSFGPGTVTVVGSNTQPLSGTGTLVNLLFTLGPTAGSTTLTLANALFNEGSPAVTGTTNGLLTATALPVIAVSPNSGEIAVGEALAFTTSGGTPPFTYSSSNPAVADFAGDAVLNGLAPGAVAVTSTDDMGLMDTTSGVVDVRALRLTAGTVAGAPGDVVQVPLIITDPGPFAITSAEFRLTYTASRVTALGVTTAGTLVSGAGWATPAVNVSAGQIIVSMAGVNPLTAAGTLVLLDFQIEPTATSSSSITIQEALFNEVYPSANTNGFVTVNAFPVITISPNTATLVVGETVQFGVSGITVPPLVWSVVDGAVGSIDATGLFTAIGRGQTEVSVVDNVGASDVSGTIDVCDFYISAPTATLLSFSPTLLPVQIDRDVTGMGIFGYELTLNYDASRLQMNSASNVGTLSSGGSVVTNSLPGQLIVVYAGANPLTGTLPLVEVEVQLLVPLLGTSTTVTLSRAFFNEGSPCARTITGTVNAPTAAPDLPTLRDRLGQNVPNPFNPQTRIEYSLVEPGHASLRVYSAAGALVRTLVDRNYATAGNYSARWDGRDDAGSRLASGIYFYRFQFPGGSYERKMVLLK